MEYIKAKDYILNKLKENLDPRLTYHGIHHTLDVLQAAEMLAEKEGVNSNDRTLLLTAAAYHDSGMLRTYVGHEKASIEIARETLPAFGYSQDDLDIIDGLVMATELPQSAMSHIEKIICDADLDYLGRSDFFMIAHQLRYEWEAMEFKPTTLKEWYQLQLDFLGRHEYMTKTARDLRESKKQQNLKQVEELVCFMKKA